MNTGCKIVYGPERSLLYSACEYAYDDYVRAYVPFNLSQERPQTPGALPLKIRELRIAGITHEDDSGHHLILVGHCKANLKGDDNLVNCTFRAVYDSKKREGHITFS